MIKVAYLIKRRSDLSFEQFRDYYENHHSKLVAMAPAVSRYRRRYLQPFINPFDNQTPVASYDVMMEIWFEDRAAFDAALLSQSEENVALIVEDEARFMDRASMLLFTIEEECETAVQG